MGPMEALPSDLALATEQCLISLVKWGRGKVGKYGDRIREATMDMQVAMGNLSNAGSRWELQEAEAPLESLLLEDEVYWK